MKRNAVLVLTIFLFTGNAFAFNYNRFESKTLNDVDKIERLVHKKSQILQEARQLVVGFDYRVNNPRNVKVVKEELRDLAGTKEAKAFIEQTWDNCRRTDIELRKLLDQDIKRVNKELIETKDVILKKANAFKKKMDSYEEAQFRRVVFEPLKKQMAKYNKLNEQQKSIYADYRKAKDGFKCTPNDMKNWLFKVESYNRNKMRQKASGLKHYKDNIYYDTGRCAVVGIFPKDYSKQYERKSLLRKHRTNIDKFKAFAKKCLKATEMPQSNIDIREYQPMSF